MAIPTVGDKIIVLDTKNTQDLCPDLIGTIQTITDDGKDDQPYQISNQMSTMYWFFADDVRAADSEQADPAKAALSAEIADAQITGGVEVEMRSYFDDGWGQSVPKGTRGLVQDIDGCGKATVLWLDPINVLVAQEPDQWDLLKVVKEAPPQCEKCNDSGTSFIAQIRTGCTPAECRAYCSGDRVQVTAEPLFTWWGSTENELMKKGEGGVVTEGCPYPNRNMQIKWDNGKIRLVQQIDFGKLHCTQTAANRGAASGGYPDN